MTPLARLILAFALAPVWGAAAGTLPVDPPATPTVDAAATIRVIAPDVALARRLVEERRTVAGRPVDLPMLRRFYAQRGFRPLWLGDDGSVRDAGRKALAALQAAGLDGLAADDYHAGPIARRLDAHSLDAHSDETTPVELELLLTDGVIALATHRRAGRIAPRSVSVDFAVTPPAMDPVAIGNAVAAAADPAAALEALAPPQGDHAGLKAALAALRAADAAGGWPRVPAPRAAKLEPGMRDPAVRALRQRLAASGDMTGAASASDLYDATLRQGVERFQARHGLEVDGIVGTSTVATLNVPVTDRIAQVVANMERARWFPADLGERHVAVNVPDYRLQAVENGRVVQDMRVIVGTKLRRTPIFSSTITSVVLNPTWTVPVSLAREDYLPKLLKNPGYLAEKGFTVYSSWAAGAAPLDSRRINWKAVGTGIGRLKLRQDPGPENALGQMKFNIPNGFDVYLHDTPGREKFGQTVRAFSSGCVRVGDPKALAAFVLAGDPDWPAEKRQQYLDRRETKTVTVRRPVAVHLLYKTAWVDEAGLLQFRDDVYGRDSELLEAIARRGLSVPRITLARG
ncbi:L,D-transpeptidase family protein [Azospirillum sp. RWY-5-1]|uniref:L,D-transpeptidase family protein n=1 Tax=Azospirillum oleiclasticum TaxID=2735135 RepID=A0ABX2TFB8_9PROT|nr:L,D-transpeptidase family protein [Azospirillum oleiclasticum]NYZ15741.1 L,D-transpeptidase family protein [Azospirillum oleiclasticum]NYZ22011.1 L,D-transpeptidase family protein [Azospirillum oleiclasticum]